MENQTNILAQRQFKLEELKRRGYDPYPHRFEYSHTISGIPNAVAFVGPPPSDNSPSTTGPAAPRSARSPSSISPFSRASGWR